MAATLARKLHEYLFLDTRRVTSYAEQIDGASVKMKVPEWKAEISIAGPRVTASQAQQGRDAYAHEKAEFVLEWLQKNNQVLCTSESLATDLREISISDYQFVYSTCNSGRVVFPLKTPTQQGHGAAWFISNIHDGTRGLPTRENVSICLLEDFSFSDTSIKHPTQSTYSSLVGMLWENRVALSETKIQESPEGHAIFQQRHLRDEATHKRYVYFNPRLALERLGGLAGPERRIQVLFRIREIYESSVFGVQIYGYPIFIRQA